MIDELDRRLEKLDSKFEKHIGITETILHHQQITLDEIRDIMKQMNEKFISRDEAHLLQASTLSEASDEAEEKIEAMANRQDKKYSMVGAAIAVTLATLFGLFEIIPLINSGG